MNLFILIASLFVALIFIVAGILKFINSYQTDFDQKNVSDESSLQKIRIIALSEIVVALLFLLPYYLNFLPSISVVAAFILVFLMIGAPISHIKLGEHKEAALTAFLLILILLVTFIRVFL